MQGIPESNAEWELKDWQRALSINAGTAFFCRECRNLVMVTRGGVGAMELICCGKPMERVHGTAGGKPQ